MGSWDRMERKDNDNSSYYGILSSASWENLCEWNEQLGKASEIQQDLGYLPGEIALPESLTGTEFIEMMAQLRGIEDMSHTNYLMKNLS